MGGVEGPRVLLAAGTSTGAGTTVALVEACRTLAQQLADGQIGAAEVQIPRGASAARDAAVGCVVREQGRWEAIASDLVDRSEADIYIGFADRLPLVGRSKTRVMAVQNPHLYQASNAPSLGELGRRVRTWWAARSARGADVLICATNASRDAVKAAVPSVDETRIEVRPIRPATPEPNSTWSESIERVVLLGDLYSYKRFDVALDGVVDWAVANGAADRVRVVHCGREQDDDASLGFAKAIERAEQAGVEVVRLGSVSHERAMKELRAADVLISASETETQGLTILEAMAMGVPVIARGIGPVLDLGGDAIAPFETSGGSNEVRRVIEAIEDVSTREQLAARAFVRADMAAGWNLLPPG